VTGWAERNAPKPGDLIYMRDPDSADVFTDMAWTVVDVEPPVPAERLADTMPWKTYWPVQALCDDSCRGRGVQCWFPEPHHLLLSADDFVPVSQLPNFTVVRGVS
jgi:hypothetical protein